MTMELTYTKGDTIIREKAQEALIHAARPDGTLSLSEAVAAIMKVPAQVKGSQAVSFDPRTGTSRIVEYRDDAEIDEVLSLHKDSGGTTDVQDTEEAVD